MDVTPDGKTVYVTTQAGVVPIRTATNTALRLIQTGLSPTDVAIVLVPAT